MAMFIGYFEFSVNFNVAENRREKFIFLISILYAIYRILIRIQNRLCFLRKVLMNFLIYFKKWFRDVFSATPRCSHFVTTKR